MPPHTLLYIEDNPANLILVEQLIARRVNTRLLSAAGRATGIDLARAYQPEVILMDINLPGISGIRALKLLREDPFDRAHPGDRHQRQCDATRRTSGPRGRLLQLPNQADQRGGVHGGDGPGRGILTDVARASDAPQEDLQ